MLGKSDKLELLKMRHNDDIGVRRQLIVIVYVNIEASLMHEYGILNFK